VEQIKQVHPDALEQVLERFPEVKAEDVKQSSAQEMQEFIVENWALFGAGYDHDVLRIDFDPSYIVFVVFRV
jgi:hypothetical protein